MARHGSAPFALAIFVAGGALALACGAVFDLSALGPGGDAGVAPDAQPPVDAGADVAEAAPPEEDSSAPCVADGGSAMKRIGVYCIDSIEVTSDQYASFLAQIDAGATGAATHAGCALYADRTPSERWPPELGLGDIPVSGVNFCDAVAYCTSVGKRLCGRRGGGTLAPNTLDPDTNEWYRACSKHGDFLYPQGNNPPPGDCATSNEIRGSSNNCEGGYHGIFDMVGNVAEWIDACAGDDSEATCVAAGGSAVDHQADCRLQQAYVRQSKWPFAGIRCCAD